MKRKIVLIMRYPEPGKCKQRLAILAGEENAAHIQKNMVITLLESCREYLSTDPAALEVYYTGASEGKMRSLCGDALYKEQPEGNLGFKLSSSFRESFDEKYSEVLVIATDIPYISSVVIRSAFDSLKTNDIVIGPAYDGGYYLIGMKKDHPELFSKDIKWGGDRVFEKTLGIAGKRSLSAGVLEKLPDIDRPADIFCINNPRIVNDLPNPLISVIIPVLNEEKYLAGTLEFFRDRKNIEVIVSDGGSTDGTIGIAGRFSCKIISSAAGRAVQQNSGAEAAGSPVLLFLHADTVLPQDFEYEVYKTLSMDKTSFGAFKIKINGKNKFLGFVSFLINIRSSLFGSPYGDQALFMTKKTFEKAGGFKELFIMEDYDLVSRLKKTGRIRMSRKNVITSGRRWDGMGLLCTFFTNQKMKILFHLGTDTEKLRRIYYKELS
ncbi:MAG: TIGR04283 family arsenosugar biosynthesis glycosyltransferase [Candidatus Delongbacteria bacterium]|nr:TIGR04283 family arsenosugar biosynthesis glycosyltransferase [Candidatus Delongbacteria bacterium]